MGNTIQFKCPSCDRVLIVSRSLSGKKGRCPKCANISIIPAQPPDIVSALNIQIDDDLGVSNYANPRTKYCHYCGSIIASLAEICPRCGVRQPDQPSRGGQSRGDSPNKVVACMLALFLGLFGAHRFYLGETMWGAFYLIMTICLFWTIIVPCIFCTICVIEGIVYLTYKDSEFTEKYGRE